MLALPVSGLRTWMWPIAAPALLAAITSLAISSGVTGTAGLRPLVSAAPVTAQAMITGRDMTAVPPWFVGSLLSQWAQSRQRGRRKQAAPRQRKRRGTEPRSEETQS